MLPGSQTDAIRDIVRNKRVVLRVDPPTIGMLYASFLLLVLCLQYIDYNGLNYGKNLYDLRTIWIVFQLMSLLVVMLPKISHVIAQQ